MEKNTTSEEAQQVMRQLVSVWADFQSRLLTVPIIKRVMDGRIRLEDYQQILINHRQQVIEGSRWITLTASSITHEHADLRSRFIKHATTEHRDYLMLEDNFQATGGNLEEIRSAEKNIGSEALSAWMFYRASQSNPFDLVGAMFIIEGLGKHFAGFFAQRIREVLTLNEDQISFYTYHAQHDQEHLDEISLILDSGILSIECLADRIIKTARVTARLYVLQWEEIGNF